jgi:hypothetical protein
MNNTAVDERINALISLIDDAPNALFGGSRCTVDREQVLDMLDEIKANMPQDLKLARDIVEKRNEVISAGKREADSMKKQEEEEAAPPPPPEPSAEEKLLTEIRDLLKEKK